MPECAPAPPERVTVGHVVLVRIPGQHAHVGIAIETYPDDSALIAVGTSRNLEHRPRLPLNWDEEPARRWLRRALPWLKGVGYFYARFVRTLPRCVDNTQSSCWFEIVGDVRPLATCVTIARLYAAFLRAEARRRAKRREASAD